MNKKQLQALLASGRTTSVVEHLESVSQKVEDTDLKNEIILVSGKFNSFKRDKRSGVLNKEQEETQLAKINNALLEIINSLPEKKGVVHNIVNNRFAKWGTFVTTIAVLAGLAEITGITLKDIFSKDTPSEHNITIQEDTQNEVVDTLVKPNISPQKDVKVRKEPPKKKEENTESVEEKQPQKSPVSIEKPQGNTIINNSNINGQVITNPSGSITIENDYSTTIDTIKK